MATPTRKVYTLATGDFTSGRNVGVFFQRNLLTAFTLQSNTAASNPTTSTGAITLETAVAASNPMPLLDCPPTVTPDYSDTTGYGNSKAVARMYVDALGNVLARSSGYSFDENDSLELYVLGDPDLLQRVRVARTSEIRDVTVIRNIGEGVQAPSIERQARAGAPTCGMRRFDIGDFAPGKGVVTISRVRNDAVEPIGAFELNVAPLYSGIFSLGAISTEAVDPEFKLVTNGTDQVIAPGDASDDDLFYSIFYTPFLSGKRDTEKPFAGSKWYRHFNPAFGLVLDDVSDHFLFGLSIDLPRGFVLTAGQHYRKVTVLSEESGYAIGSVFPGAADTIPTAESWEHEKFVSVSFDIRVMAQLIRNAFTAAPN
jgi:hypothetical protein